MKTNVKGLIINPINPRKCSTEKKRKLQQSIMLFPKMLYYRDIIINKHNYVLAGNQRTGVLKEILSTAPSIWKTVLADNEQWQQLSDEEKKDVIAYWEDWKQQGQVDVTVADLSEEEEKELIIKDNNEFGEFDYEKLRNIYDSVRLIDFGFDASLFPKIKMDDNMVKKESAGSRPRKIDFLSFADRTVETTKEEYNSLVAKWDDYVDEQGLGFGFVSMLLENAPEIPE